MGPRIREDKGGGEDEFRPAFSRGQALCAGTREGRRWVPAYARTREGEKMSFGPRFHGGRLCAGTREGRRWVPAYARTREGGGVKCGKGAHEGRPYVGVG